MSENTINFQAFVPNGGGDGARVTATTTASAAVLIPGLEGGQGDPNKRRVFIANGGTVSAMVRMGQSSVQATTHSLEILPGCGYLLTPPNVGTSGVWISAITVSGTTSINVCAGEGI